MRYRNGKGDGMTPPEDEWDGYWAVCVYDKTTDGWPQREFYKSHDEAKRRCNFLQSISIGAVPLPTCLSAHGCRTVHYDGKTEQKLPKTPDGWGEKGFFIK